MLTLRSVGVATGSCLLTLRSFWTASGSCLLTLRSFGLQLGAVCLLNWGCWERVGGAVGCFSGLACMVTQNRKLKLVVQQQQQPDLAPGLPTYSKYYEGVMSRGLIGRRGPGSVCVLQQGPMKNYTVHGRVDGGNLAPLRIPIQPNIYVKSNVYRALPDFLYPLTWFRVDMGASAGADEEPHTGWMGETLHLHHYSHYTETAIGCEV